MKKRTKWIGVMLLAALFIAGVAALVAGGGIGPLQAGTQEAAAATAGGAADGGAVASLAEAVSRIDLGVNYVWVMICAFMVFFFQCGFAMVETGFCRGKNAAHTMTMNFMVFLVGALGYFLVGFALQFGGSGAGGTLGADSSILGSMLSIPGLSGILGYKGFLLFNTYNTGIYALFFFQMVFMDTTVTIPTGAMAERVKYSAVVVISFFISMVLYPLFGNWVWGGGWLAALGTTFGLGHGVVDFAGSAVVHAMGGMIALAGAAVIGPRIGKFKKDGTARAFPGHNIPMAIVGTIILFFCWFAFNAGSTLSGSDLRLSVVATNTMIAGAVGGLVAMFYMWIRFGKPDPSMTANGALAGLVAITAPCAFVNAAAALIIGFVAAILVCVAVPFVENKLKLDDPVGAISVHCVNGLWGVLAVGLFADGSYGDGINGVSGGVRGLFYGDASQLFAQLIAVAVLFIWGAGVSYVFMKALDKIMGLRVRPEDELEGLDVPEMGVPAYPDNPPIRSALDFDEADNAPVPQLSRFSDYTARIIPAPASISAAPSSAAEIGAAEALSAPVEHAVPVEFLQKSGVKFTKVEIITKQGRFEALKEAMNRIGITGMTVTQVLGCGIQKGKPEYYRGVEVEMDLLPKVRVEIVVSKVPVRTVVETAKQVLYTGHIGDGKIFVYDVENVIRVRTGEEGYDALQDEALTDELAITAGRKTGGTANI